MFHEYTNSLAPLVQSLLVETMRQFQSLNMFEHHPDVVDDSFILAGRCLRYCPKILVMSELIGPILDWGILGMHVQHKDACLSIQDFFQKLIKLARDGSPIAAEVRSVLPARGPIMVRIVACFQVEHSTIISYNIKLNKNAYLF